MKTQWRKGLVKTSVWLAAEILLNCLGIDDLADYSEFIFERHFSEFIFERQVMVVQEG